MRTVLTLHELRACTVHDGALKAILGRQVHARQHGNIDSVQVTNGLQHFVRTIARRHLRQDLARGRLRVASITNMKRSTHKVVRKQIQVLQLKYLDSYSLQQSEMGQRGQKVNVIQTLYLHVLQDTLDCGSGSWQEAVGS